MVIYVQCRVLSSEDQGGNVLERKEGEGVCERGESKGFKCQDSISLVAGVMFLFYGLL